MKTVSFRLTDKQYHYLSAVAKDQRRSIEHLVWLALGEGIDYMFNEETYYVQKLQCDFTEADKESLEKYPLTKPSWGNEYYGPHPWSDEISENVLADIDGSFAATDAVFDLQAEIDATAALHAQRKADHDAKEQGE